MKSYTIILSLFALVTVISCKKENTKGGLPTDKISVDGATVVSRGDIVFSAESTNAGIVKIYRLQNGNYVLGLEQMNFTSNRDVELYLSKTADLTAFSIKLFSFLSINGELYYLLPSHINIQDCNYVVLQNDLAQIAIASAELR